MKRDRQNFLSFWTVFFPFTTKKNQYFEKKEKKKVPVDIIILQGSNINNNHMVYGS